MKGDGAEEMQWLIEGGFSNEEISSWRRTREQELTDAGFNDGEISTYFGKPPFDPAPIEQHFNETLAQATAPKTEGGAHTEVDNPFDAFITGLQGSSGGLAVRGKAPSMDMPEHTSMAMRIAESVGGLAGDIPAMAAGFLIGGGPLSPVTGTAGAFALPAGLRKILMDKYENGEVDDFQEFWARFSGTVIDTSKAWVTGAATGAVGKAIKLAPAMMSHRARAAATMTGEISTMVSVGAALEGKVPQPADFVETAMALGVLKGVHKGASKLRKIYAETGVHPHDVAADSQRDPTITQDLASENIDLPRSYSKPVSVDEIHAKADEIGVPWDDDPAFKLFTKTVTDKETLDELSPRDRQDVFKVLEDLEKDIKQGQQEIPVPPPTVGEKPIIGREVSSEDDAPLFNKSQRQPDEEQGGLFTKRDPLPPHEAALVPRHELPPEQNAELLARAEKGQADLDVGDSAGADRQPSIIDFLRSKGGVRDEGGELKTRDVDAGRFGKNTLIRKKGMSLDQAAEAVAEEFPDRFPKRDIGELLKALDDELHGRGGDPEWLGGLLTGKGKMTRQRVGKAMELIFQDKGRDKGADVEKVKAALLADGEFMSSDFAPKTQEDWDRITQHAVEEWEPDIAMGGGAPPRPPKGTLYDDQNAKPKDEPGEHVPPTGEKLYEDQNAKPKDEPGEHVPPTGEKLYEDQGAKPKDDPGEHVPPTGEKLYDDQNEKPKDDPGEHVPPTGETLYAKPKESGAERPISDTPYSTAEKEILNHITEDDKKQAGATFGDFRQSAIDNLDPIRRKLLQAGLMHRNNAKSMLPTSENPYFLERLTRGVMGKFVYFMKHGAFDFDTYKTLTKGYEEILAQTNGDLDGFRAYIAAKRAIEMHKNGQPTVFPLDAARVVVRGGAERFEQTAKDRIEFKHVTLDGLRKSGILSDSDVTAMKQAVKDHIPMYRFFEEDAQGQPRLGNSVRNPIKRQKGSEDYLVKDPIMSDVRDTALFIALAEKNVARQMYVRLGKNFAVKLPEVFHVTKLTEPEIEGLFNEYLNIKTIHDDSSTETVKTTTTTTTTTKTTETGGDGNPKKEPSKQAKLVEARIKEALLARSFHEGEAEQMMRRLAEMRESRKETETLIETKETVERLVKEVNATIYVPELDIRVPSQVATIFRKMQQPTKADEIAVYHSGKRELYKVDPGIAEAFEDLDRISSNKVVNALLHVPAGLLRAGVILTPDYIVRNILRDSVSALIYSGAHPLKTIMGGIELVRKGEAWHNWMKGGGANATMVALDRNFVSKELVDLHIKTGFLTRAWNVARKPLDILRAASEFAENATRLGSVRSELMQAKDKATIQALALLSREATVDFSVHGRDTQEFGKATAFFNPTIQGIDRFAREMRAKPIATTAKALAYVTLPSILLWWAGKDDEEIQALPDWQKIMFNIARIPLPGTDDQGKPNSFLLRIPKTQEFGLLFGTLPERLLEQFVQDNPDAWDGINDALFQTFTPGVIPTAIVPILDQFANRSTFTHQPIIPSYLEGLVPEYQYTDYTTELAKAIGATLGAFPGIEEVAVGNKLPYIGGVARALTTPILIESYVRDWTGGTGMYLLRLADAALRKTGVLPDPIGPAWALEDIPFVKALTIKYPSSGAKHIQDFFENHDIAMVYKKTADHLKGQGHPKVEAFLSEHAEDMLSFGSVREMLSGQYRLIRLIAKNPQISAQEQAQQIDTIYFGMIALTKGVNDAMRKTLADGKTLKHKQELVSP